MNKLGVFFLGAFFVVVFGLTSVPAFAGKTLKYRSGATCTRPEGLNLGEWKALEQMVKAIDETERRINVFHLKMPQEDFDGGKRFVHIEFDCASLVHLKKRGDKGRKKDILALLGGHMDDSIMSARDFQDDFKEGVKKYIIGAHEADQENERKLKVTLKNGELRIYRKNWNDGGGWTEGEWKKFFESNL